MPMLHRVPRTASVLHHLGCYCRSHCHRQDLHRCPCSHFPSFPPFACAPAIGAKQSDLFAAECCTYFIKHRLEFTFFQNLCSHCRAAKGDGIIISYFACRKIVAIDQFCVCSLYPAAPFTTAFAISSVLPEPLQYTTATLLISYPPF